MEYRRLGRTGLSVSAIGLGTGGPSLLGQRSGVDSADAVALVHRALDLGINLFDTAAIYGDSETILGRALDGVARDSYVLCSKFRPVDPPQAEGSPHRYKTERDFVDGLEQSLRRLGVDHLDVLQFHGVLPEHYQETRDRFLPIAQKMQERGQLRFIGLTENFAADHRHETLRRGLADDVFDQLMVGYNLLTPAPEQHVLPEALSHDVGIVVMCAVRRAISDPGRLRHLVRRLVSTGLLTPDAVPAEAPLDWLISENTPTIAAAGYQYAAGHPAVSCVLTGTADKEHLEQNVCAVLAPPLEERHRRRLVSIFGPIGLNLGD